MTDISNTNEEILGIFSVSEISGRGMLTREDPCVLYFTTNRLIVAKQTGPLARLRQRLQISSGGSNVVYVRDCAKARERLKWKEVPIDSYLKDSPKNYEISYDDISAIEIQDRKFGTRLLVFCEDLDEPKYVFRTTSRVKEDRQVLDRVLHTALPDKV